MWQRVLGCDQWFCQLVRGICKEVRLEEQCQEGLENKHVNGSLREGIIFTDLYVSL